MVVRYSANHHIAAVADVKMNVAVLNIGLSLFRRAYKYILDRRILAEYSIL